MKLHITAQTDAGLSRRDIADALAKSLEGRSVKKALIVPPDYTRLHSNAGFITNTYYHLLLSRGCRVDILPAVGSHEPMTREECALMYGDIPLGAFIPHNWRTDTVRLGEVPAEFVCGVTGGLFREPIAAELNRTLLDESYDLILSVGQVVPHEVVGMAGYSKNLFVGCGGSGMIGKSHLIGAVYGMQRIMGRDHTPVRKIYDYALEHFYQNRPLLFALTVTTAPGGNIRTHGLFIGDGRDTLEAAISLSQEKNIELLDRPIRKCVVYLDEKEFKSAWLGNKAVYRTRMAIADGGELLILAPGVAKFGEDGANDLLIRKYGYAGTDKVLSLSRENADLGGNLSALSHLLHGSVGGRFRITYAAKKLTRQEVEGVHFCFLPYAAASARYNPEKLGPGWNTLEDGEEIFFVPNPALGLWAEKKSFYSL